jgi:3,4-dihydroxy 2-butanone 4-phosphate synthase/GTP cyclohydrolase II
MIAYESEVNGGESHVALVRGDLCPGCPAFEGASAGLPGDPDYRPPCTSAVLVRVHTRCTAGDVFGADCRCREVLDQSMRMIAEAGCGALIYLHNTSRGFEIDHTPQSAFGPGGQVAPRDVDPVQPGRLILHHELRSREAAQDRTGRILRAIGLGGQILSDLGIQRIRLLSNTPMHIPALEGFGLEIVEQVPIPIDDDARASEKAKSEQFVVPADQWSVIEE